MNVKAEVLNNTETKPGLLTTEFWTLVLAEAAVFIELATDAFNIPNSVALVVGGALAMAYKVARGLAKTGQPHYPAYAPDTAEILDEDLEDDEDEGPQHPPA